MTPADYEAIIPGISITFTTDPEGSKQTGMVVERFRSSRGMWYRVRLKGIPGEVIVWPSQVVRANWSEGE